MEEELLKRWRLILGGDEADGTGVTLNLEGQWIAYMIVTEEGGWVPRLPK